MGVVWSNPQVVRLRRLVAAGETVRSMARIMGKSEKSISKAVARYGLRAVDGRSAAERARWTSWRPQCAQGGWPPMPGRQDDRDREYVRRLVTAMIAEGLVRAPRNAASPSYLG